MRRIVLLALALAAAAAPASAGSLTKFRFATISTGDNAIDVTLGWRRSAPFDGKISFGDGTPDVPFEASFPLDFPALDLSVGTMTISHSFVGTGPHTISISGCCRQGSPVSTDFVEYKVVATKLAGGASAHPIQIPYVLVEQDHQLDLPLPKRVMNARTCRLATFAESGIPRQPGQPAGAPYVDPYLDPNSRMFGVAPDCTSLHWNAAGAPVGQYAVRS